MLTENEFRNKYFEREYYANLIKNTIAKMEPPKYEEEQKIERSR